MLIALISLIAIGSPNLVEEPVPTNRLPEIQITADKGNVEVRIGEYKLTGARVTIDPKSQQIVVEGGDVPSTLRNGKSTVTGKKISLDLVSNRYTVTVTGTGTIRDP
jgi:lipopolysaccharide assembly outer membrane protein LptD (OstA)